MRGLTLRRAQAGGAISRIPSASSVPGSVSSASRRARISSRFRRAAAAIVRLGRAAVNGGATEGSGGQAG